MTAAADEPEMSFPQVPSLVRSGERVADGLWPLG